MSFSLFDIISVSPENQLRALQSTASIDDPSEAMRKVLSLGKRLIQVSRNGTVATKDPVITEQFIKFMAQDMTPIYTDTSYAHTYNSYTLGDLLLHMGALSEQSQDYATALKIYTHLMTLKHSTTPAHQTHAHAHLIECLTALGRHIEASEKMSPTEFRQFYSTHPEALEKLIAQYESKEQYREAIEILYQFPDRQHLMIKKLALYASKQPKVPFFRDLLTTSLKTILDPRVLINALKEEGQIGAAFYLHQRLFGETSLNTSLEYGKLAFEKEDYDTAYSLLQNGIQKSLSQKDTPFPNEHYDSLIPLWKCAEILDLEEEVLFIIDQLLKHPNHDRKYFLEVIFPQFSRSFIQTLSQIPQLSHNCYTMLLALNHNQLLSEQDLAMWFFPLISSYEVRNQTEHAIDLLLSCLTMNMESSGPNEVWISLFKKLGELAPEAAIDYLKHQTEKLHTLNQDKILLLCDLWTHLCKKSKKPAYQKVLHYIKEFIKTLHTLKHQDSNILAMCDLLLSLESKNPHALCCRAIARYRLATDPSCVDPDQLIYEGGMLLKPFPNQHTIQLIVEDLKKAYYNASGHHQQLYLRVLSPFLRDLQQAGISTREHERLLARYHTSNAIYNLDDLCNTTSEEIEKGQKRGMFTSIDKRTIANIEKGQKEAAFVNPAQEIYTQMFAYIYKDKTSDPEAILAPNIHGNYDFPAFTPAEFPDPTPFSEPRDRFDEVATFASESSHEEDEELITAPGSPQSEFLTPLDSPTSTSPTPSSPISEEEPAFQSPLPSHGLSPQNTSLEPAISSSITRGPEPTFHGIYPPTS